MGLLSWKNGQENVAGLQWISSYMQGRSLICRAVVFRMLGSPADAFDVVGIPRMTCVAGVEGAKQFFREVTQPRSSSTCTNSNRATL